MTAIELYADDHSADFEARLAHSQQVLREAVARFAPITQANSLGVEDMVITDILHRLDLKTDIFVLETGRLHAQTLDLLERAQNHYQRPFSIYHPDAQAVQDFVTANGKDAMYKSMELRKACCNIRKMEPLDRALAGKQAWITGLRREQSGARAEVPYVDESGNLPKINPLADWTLGDLWHYVALHDVPYNILHDRFYPSIGCEPCTRAVTLGEDFRSGRWWWEGDNARECGLHVQHGDDDATTSDSTGQAHDATVSPISFLPLR